MLSGRLAARVLNVAPVSIHGDVYAEVTVQTEGQRAANECSVVRVAAHAIEAGRGGVEGELRLVAGAWVELELLMGQVVRCWVERGPLY